MHEHPGMLIAGPARPDARANRDRISGILPVVAPKQELLLPALDTGCDDGQASCGTMQNL